MTRDLAVVRLDRTAVEARGHRQQYTMGSEPKEVSGLQSLVQTVTIALLSEPGSHVLDPSLGVGIVTSLRRATSLDAVRADAVVAVSRLRDQISQRQAGEAMPDDERLADLVLERVFKEEDSYVIFIQVISAAGSRAVINSQDFFV
jgi:hypothetical protein